MIIGNGLLANAFKCLPQQENSVIIFASGVSNSKEFSKAAFDREKNLLLKSIKDDAMLVYFSTCSVEDNSLNDTPYIIHKREIESYIQQQVQHYIIFRLPIVVGNTSNPNTLTNYLFNKINNGEKITAYALAYRYLIDVDDIAKIVSIILRRNDFNNQIINIVLGKPIKVIDLISIFEQVLQIK